ncbi:hypothetical protein [Flavobacterium sp. HSC-61S13]|uniref:hypothetical protein n=1 Tax=Flavobacterium sp. HSC-61S13 TaxID=2910963 RepID=UPI00209CB4DC|nr:hypothetical protein [Flavobacterium sp. HSC-61S13]MCP1997575.1 hypothetical protein [Flavobacterium sp. HSC-61S13]
MKKYLYALIFISLVSCNSYKSQLSEKGNYEDAIFNGIIDFSNTQLFLEGKVFFVNFDLKVEDYYAFSIMDNSDKLLFSEKKAFSDNYLPNKFIIYKNKLFFWWDDNYGSDKDILEKLILNNKIQNEEESPFIDFETDEKKKGAKYFFCKNNLKKYKRVITNLGIIKTPKLNCE